MSGLIDSVSKVFVVHHERGSMHFEGFKTNADAAEGLLRRGWEGGPQQHIDGLGDFNKRLTAIAANICEDFPQIGCVQHDCIVCQANANLFRQMRSRIDTLEAQVESAGMRDVFLERVRQQTEELYTPQHDDQHDAGELASAGAAYALNGACVIHPLNGTPFDETPLMWPWEAEAWQPDAENPRHDLVRAAALIIAEIERMDRATAPTGAA